MPAEPILITGRLGVRDRGQSVLITYKLEIQLQIAAGKVSGSYTLFDANGQVLERFLVSRQPGQKPKYEYSVGNPPAPATTPDVFATIRDTGITWSDLSLPFLWWRDGTLAGSASVRGRDCFIIDVRPPADAETKQAIVARVWIDKEYRMLLQAEEYGSDSKMLRRLSVESFKKINNEWMIKDIVVTGSTNLPRGYKSFMTIQDMRQLANPRQNTQPSGKTDTGTDKTE